MLSVQGRPSSPGTERNPAPPRLPTLGYKASAMNPCWAAVAARCRNYTDRSAKAEAGKRSLFAGQVVVTRAGNIQAVRFHKIEAQQHRGRRADVPDYCESYVIGFR